MLGRRTFQGPDTGGVDPIVATGAHTLGEGLMFRRLTRKFQGWNFGGDAMGKDDRRYSLGTIGKVWRHLKRWNRTRSFNDCDEWVLCV